MSIKSYVPILRPKQGEVFAIRDLSDVAQNRITPFFDVHRVQLRNGRKEKSIDKHLDSIIERIYKHWPSNREFFWDLFSIDLSERLQDGKHPVLWFGRKLHNKGMIAIPTIGSDRDASYIKAIQDLLRKGKTESVCIRILPDDLETPRETISELRNILQRLEIAQSKCHLLIDMRVIKEAEIEEIVEMVSEFTSQCDIDSWKTFTFSSCSFPIDMSWLSPNTESRVIRAELILWNALIKAKPLIGRKPNFSDYAINNPEKPDIDPMRIRAGGKIRYATENDWIIVKGHGLHRGERFNQYRKLSRKVMDFPDYRGTSYSWGDDYLDKCWKEGVGTGNLTTWITVDTNHHLTLVGEQISTLCDF